MVKNCDGNRQSEGREAARRAEKHTRKNGTFQGIRTFFSVPSSPQRKFVLPNLMAANSVATVLSTALRCKPSVVTDVAEYMAGIVTENEFSLPIDDVAALLEAQLDSCSIATAGCDLAKLANDVICTLKSNGASNASTASPDVPALLKAPVVIGPATPIASSPASAEPPKAESSDFPVSKSKSGGKAVAAGSKTSEVVAASMAEAAELDDWGSAWQDVVNSGETWGGRGHGGRGMKRITQLNAGKDVVLEGVTLAFAGKDLLSRSQIRLIHDHKYALLGANGVGKTTLMRRMAACAIPGFPRHLKVAYVEQEFMPQAPRGTTATAFLSRAIAARGGTEFDFPLTVTLSGGDESTRDAIETDIAALECELEMDHDDDELNVIVQRLSVLEDRLRAMDIEEANVANMDAALSVESDDDTESVDDAGELLSKSVRTQAKRLLTLLGFDRQTRHCPLHLLSGGWRARLGLALGLLAKPDILLLDEPTNHLDLNGVFWLQHFLSSAALKDFGIEILVIVSHDRSFLDAVVTDVIMFAEQKLTTFPGTVSEYFGRMSEREDHMSRLRDAKHKQEKKMQAFIASAQTSTSKKPGKAKFVDPKKQKAAKEKKAKLARLGWYRSDGKQFALRSLKKFDEESLRMPEEVQEARRAKPLHFKFPAPDDIASSLRSITDPTMPVIRLTNAAVGYGRDITTAVLSKLTLEISLKSRISLVGVNGCGKSTLLKLILGELAPLSGPDSVWKHHNLRIAFVPQHHADVLDAHAQATPVQYLMEAFHITTELKARAHLGAFGLTGAVQLQPIGSLSGGQKARLSFACVTWNHPHVIIMDEPTNHLDMESIEALAAGLRAFEGAVLLVSHNAAFMQAVCNELWVVECGSVTPHKQLRTTAAGESDSDDDEDAGFALFFEEYKRSIVENIRKGKRV